MAQLVPVCCPAHYRIAKGGTSESATPLSWCTFLTGCIFGESRRALFSDNWDGYRSVSPLRAPAGPFPLRTPSREKADLSN